MHSLGVNSYRFSISWSRVLPSKSCQFSNAPRSFDVGKIGGCRRGSTNIKTESKIDLSRFEWFELVLFFCQLVLLCFEFLKNR